MPQFTGQNILKEEVENEKATGPDALPAEALKALVNIRWILLQYYAT